MFDWKCPKCNATPSKCGKGRCRSETRAVSCSDCEGFLCECDTEESMENPEHGTTFESQCENAVCYHCGYVGRFPKKPKGLQKWEKQALDAGWTPPVSRALELGMSVVHSQTADDSTAVSE